MNKQFFFGVLVQNPELVVTENTKMVKLLVKVPENKYHYIVQLEAWGTAAEYIANNFVKDDYIVAETILRPQNKYRMTNFVGPLVRKAVNEQKEDD